MTILLSFLNFGPYHLARLVEAQRLAEVDGVRVCGLEMARLQSEYAWGETTGQAPWCASPGIPLEEVHAIDWLNYLPPIFDEVNPDVCAIAGYSHPAMLSLITLCIRRSIPWVIMSDSREIDLPRKKWREWLKGRVVKLASSGFAAGRTHIEYLANLGMSPELCSNGYDVVDNARFAIEASKWRSLDAPNEGVGEKVIPAYFLSPSRFIPEKNLFRLLDAYALYRRKSATSAGPTRHHCALCILGNGELKSSLIEHAGSLGLTVIECAPWEQEEGGNAEIGDFEIRDRGAEICLETGPTDEARSTKHRLVEKPTVFLPGFRQIDELPRFYAHADATILASTKDTWGLVINEAMASSLPVIVSNRCGSAPELVRESVNGFTFDPYKIDELASLMVRLSEMPETERHSMGEAGKHIIADWGLDRFAAGLRQAADKALTIGPKKACLLDRVLLRSLILLSYLRS